MDRVPGALRAIEDRQGSNHVMCSMKWQLVVMGTDGHYVVVAVFVMDDWDVWTFEFVDRAVRMTRGWAEQDWS
jgi:hypothetical protein